MRQSGSSTCLLINVPAHQPAKSCVCERWESAVQEGGRAGSPAFTRYASAPADMPQSSLGPEGSLLSREDRFRSASQPLSHESQRRQQQAQPPAKPASQTSRFARPTPDPSQQQPDPRPPGACHCLATDQSRHALYDCTAELLTEHERNGCLPGLPRQGSRLIDHC